MMEIQKSCDMRIMKLLLQMVLALLDLLQNKCKKTINVNVIESIHISDDKEKLRDIIKARGKNFIRNMAL